MVPQKGWFYEFIIYWIIFCGCVYFSYMYVFHRIYCSISGLACFHYLSMKSHILFLNTFQHIKGPQPSLPVCKVFSSNAVFISCHTNFVIFVPYFIQWQFRAFPRTTAQLTGVSSVFQLYGDASGFFIVGEWKRPKVIVLFAVSVHDIDRWLAIVVAGIVSGDACPICRAWGEQWIN